MAKVDKQYRVGIPSVLIQRSSFSNDINSGVEMRVMEFANRIEIFPATGENMKREFCSVILLDNKRRFNIPSQIVSVLET